MSPRTSPTDGSPEAWARATRAVLRRALRREGERPGMEKSHVLHEAAELFDSYRNHTSVTAETLLHVLAGRLDRRRSGLARAADCRSARRRE